MNRFLFFQFQISLTMLVRAQDTVMTNYPGTDQLWEKIYSEGKKLNETIYYTTGDPWMRADYKGEEEQWNWYYENGNPYFSATIINDSLQGTYRIWYSNGQLAEQIEYKDHLENGKATFYYPNGQKSMSGTYKNGEMLDDWIFLNEEGKLKSGEWNWVFAADSNEVRMYGRLLNGEMIGEWKYTSLANLNTSKSIKFRKVITK